MSPSIETVVEALYAALERNDFVAVAALYGDDLKVWHSFDLETQNKADHLVTLTALNKRWASHYRVIERHYIGDRMIQRHGLTWTEPDGTVALRQQAAAFLTIRDGQIHALDEYLDSRDVAELMAALPRSA